MTESSKEPARGRGQYVRVRVLDGDAVETTGLQWALRYRLRPWPVVLGVGQLSDGRACWVVVLEGHTPVAAPLAGLERVAEQAERVPVAVPLGRQFAADEPGQVVRRLLEFARGLASADGQLALRLDVPPRGKSHG